MPTEHFDRLDTEWDQNPTRAAMTAAVAQAVLAALELQPCHRLLEYGCGTAALSFLLAPPWTIAYRLPRNHREYPLFLLTAGRAGDKVE